MIDKYEVVVVFEQENYIERLLNRLYNKTKALN
jgi:hypothetical protein